MGIQRDYDLFQTNATNYDEVRALYIDDSEPTFAAEMLIHDIAVERLGERYTPSEIGRHFGAGSFKGARTRLAQFYRVYWENEDAEKAAKAAGYL